MLHGSRMSHRLRTWSRRPGTDAPLPGTELRAQMDADAPGTVGATR
jgi:hypothetical protein